MGCLCWFVLCLCCYKASQFSKDFYISRFRKIRTTNLLIHCLGWLLCQGEGMRGSGGWLWRRLTTVVNLHLKLNHSQSRPSCLNYYIQSKTYIICNHSSTADHNWSQPTMVNGMPVLICTVSLLLQGIFVPKRPLPSSIEIKDEQQNYLFIVLVDCSAMGRGCGVAGADCGEGYQPLLTSTWN